MNYIKRFISIVMAITLAFCISSCGKNQGDTYKVKDVAGLYVSEDNSEITGYFTLNLNEDETFSYSESPISSHLGMGRWEIDGSYVIIHDTIQGDERDFVFEFKDGNLYFVKDESDRFLYTSPEDGFKLIPQE